MPFEGLSEAMKIAEMEWPASRLERVPSKGITSAPPIDILI